MRWALVDQRHPERLQALELLFLRSQPILLHGELRTNRRIELLLVRHPLLHPSLALSRSPELPLELRDPSRRGKPLALGPRPLLAPRVCIRRRDRIRARGGGLGGPLVERAPKIRELLRPLHALALRGLALALAAREGLLQILDPGRGPERGRGSPGAPAARLVRLLAEGGQLLS